MNTYSDLGIERSLWFIGIEEYFSNIITRTRSVPLTNKGQNSTDRKMFYVALNAARFLLDRYPRNNARGFQNCSLRESLDIHSGNIAERPLQM